MAQGTRGEGKRRFPQTEGTEDLLIRGDGGPNRVMQSSVLEAARAFVRHPRADVGERHADADVHVAAGMAG